MMEMKADLKDNQRDYVHIFLAVAVFLIALVTYLRTVQPTVPYWDCGEFIASAAVLGVPHPPGTPLFMLVGRMFAMLPFGEIAWRVNIVSSVASALAVMFGYLIVTWIIRKWYKNADSIYKRATIYVGGVTGALFMAFSRTFWNNAVEAEVYGLSMLIMLASIFLVFKWYDHRREPSAEKYLYAFAFISVLALGIHMTSFIVVPIAFIFMLAVDRKLRTNWPFLATFIILNVIPVSVTAYLVLSAAWATISAIIYFWDRIKEGWIYTIFIPLVIMGFMYSFGYSIIPLLIYSLAGWSLLTLLIYGLRPARKMWRMAFLITLLGLMGFSSQLYIPIRSMADPVIDMNNPETWSGVRDLIERKQYGSESMFTRMLHRRAEWKNQFGTHERMGFWGFFNQQYSPVKWFWLFFPLGMFGIFYVVRQRWRMGTFMFLILLAGTIGLVLYMNFADGTQANQVLGIDHLEVRDRDYFFTPGFILFGLFIGLGLAGIMHAVFDALTQSKVTETMKKVALVVLALTVLTPLFAFSRNYFYSDRSKNYLPYDYAMNLLSSCKPNAVLFTNGDNDTFPVWCLQYAYRIRPDVRVMVLSLLRADWYIEQYRDEFNVPISYSNEDINLLRPKMVDGEYYSISNLITDNIIDNAMVKSTRPDLWPDLPMKYAQFKRKYAERAEGDTSLYFDPPIQFATTVDNLGLKYDEKPIGQGPVDGVIQGLVYDIHPNKVPNKIDAAFTSDYFLNTFNSRGVTDEGIYKDENARRLAENYWRIVAKMADQVFAAGRQSEAIDMNYRAVQISVSPVEAFRFLVKNLKYAGRLPEVDDYMEKVNDAPKEDLMAMSAKMMDVLFAMDISNSRTELRKSGMDPAAADSTIAQDLIQDPQYHYYMDFLDRLIAEYPENQDALSYADRANTYVLKHLPQQTRDDLKLKFPSTISKGINPDNGG